MVSIQKILVPIDFSENSEKALRYGLEMGRDHKAKIICMHVINQRTLDTIHDLSVKGYKGDYVAVVKKLTSDTKENLQKMIPENLLEELHPEFLVRKGKPTEEIVNVAKEMRIDLIIIGSQGRSSLASKFMGSVAHNVVNHAPCPVLIVRPITHDFLK